MEINKIKKLKQKVKNVIFLFFE